PGYADTPCDVRGHDHVPNSDLYDIAYVQPAFVPAAAWSNTSIAKAIAHEAGHTFGLVHIRTESIDPTPLLTLQGAPPEVMSYDSANTRFANKTFAVTDWNYTNGGLKIQGDYHPHYQDDIISKQNSFTYPQTRIGSRPLDDHPNVA